LVDRETFDRRLAMLEELLRRLRGVVVEGRERFLVDVALQAQAERWLHLAGECALDLAHHLIADRGWRTPTSYRDAFAVLAAEGVLAPHQVTAMEGWAGLRNVLVHLYLDVNHDRIWDVLEGELDQLVDYAVTLAAEADRDR
jgi:uncharacterized protein YutE (UPF0331/DUF86 family)